MGIDARLLIRYKGEKPTDDQLTRWSWNLCKATDAKHFFISDGLPLEEYEVANNAWHEAFDNHHLYQSWMLNGDRDIHKLIVKDIGEPPKELCRAIELTNRRYPITEQEWEEDEYYQRIPKTHLKPGLCYTQDGDPVIAEPGEWLMEVSLWTRYYGPGYERGDILTICAIAEWIEINMQPCEVWYGGDSSGVLVEPFGEAERRKMKEHLYSEQGRDYYNHSFMNDNRTAPMPKPCGLCVKGENRFNQYGSGMAGNYIAVHCQGCGKSFETKDHGLTWNEPEKDKQF